MFIKCRVTLIDEFELDMSAKHKVEHTYKHKFLEVQMSLHVPSHAALKYRGGLKHI